MNKRLPANWLQDRRAAPGCHRLFVWTRDRESVPESWAEDIPGPLKAARRRAHDLHRELGDAVWFGITDSIGRSCGQLYQPYVAPSRHAVISVTKLVGLADEKHRPGKYRR